MYKKLAIIFLAPLISFTSINTFAKEPKNLDMIKARLIQYHNSGEYEKDQAKVINQAMEYLKTRLARERKSSAHEKFAVVLDIDETSLSNYDDLQAIDFARVPNTSHDAGNKGTNSVIQPTLNLYRYAKENNIAVFFITGRTETSRPATEKNLQQAGFNNWDGLTFKPKNYHEKTAAIYKAQTREQIEKQGYDIVLNIGDQQSDLIGGHADKSFKLPNPYYFIL